MVAVTTPTMLLQSQTAGVRKTFPPAPLPLHLVPFRESDHNVSAAPELPLRVLTAPVNSADHTTEIPHL